MTDFIIKKLPYDLSSHSGLAFVGKYLKSININASALKNLFSTRAIYPQWFVIIKLCGYKTLLMNSPACTRLLHPRYSNIVDAPWAGYGHK